MISHLGTRRSGSAFPFTAAFPRPPAPCVRRHGARLGSEGGTCAASEGLGGSGQWVLLMASARHFPSPGPGVL